MFQLSFSLVGGLLLSRVAKKFNFPAITAYLIFGVLIGPYCIGALHISELGFTTPESISNLNIVSQVALGFIAFTIGNEFRLSQLKAMGKKAIAIGIGQAIFTTFLVDVALIILHFISPNIISISSAITLGAIASATAPAATLMVIRQYKANGPLTKLLLLVVAIDDAVGLMLFAASFGIAHALENGVISILTILIEPTIEIVFSLVIGVIGGWILNWLERYFHSESKRLCISIGLVLLIVGISMIEFEIAGVKCGFSLLLVCMMMGTIFCNICDFSEELMERIDGWTSPLFVLFFVLSGAELNLGILSQPMVLLIGMVYIAFRSFGKYFGAFCSCAITHCSEKTTKHLGITLLPQAGVALGMALTAQQLAGGEIVRNVVLFSVLIYELVGPALTKRSLIAAGEIQLSNIVSARRRNKQPNN